MFKQTAWFVLNDFFIFMFNTINMSNWRTLSKALKILREVGKCTNVLVIRVCHERGYKIIIDKVIGYLYNC